MRMLIVDDSRTMRKIIRTALEEVKDAPTEILEAADGIEALQLLRNEKLEIDLVLIDWNMPRLDGIGFLKQLRVISPFRDTYVIMVTSQANRANVAEALRWGACDYVVKPFVPEVLHDKIRKIASKIETKRCEETSVMLRAMAESRAADGEPPFLDQLPADLVEEIRSLGTWSDHGAGAVLISPGVRVDLLPFLLQGAVEVVPSPPAEPELRRPGDCFADQGFVSGDPAGYSAVARTAVKVLSLSRIQVAELARKRHEFSYALSRWVTRPSRQQKASPAAGLVGRLETMPMADLVQVLHICRKTGVLRLTQGSESASLYFEEGEARHALLGEQSGEEAFYRMAAWTEAGFEFESGKRAGIVTIQQPIMTLLMEGLRRVDESKRTGSPCSKG
ncbi:MAG TPA: response regulator [Planctomycetota bacterium]|nr:response regulator [Planctomycetota bacterium]